ncbi:D-2-hydroxyacid dehydrogenase [Pseudonocardia sp. TRM90224]|uniref:D-2-hydroxyacid dehydrogenase n=1 Tax=Pseudonocardia sp. TRM90224 TaxID=2812678 RepID=UPI001E629A11|nr:D-2-hydroxyacid dehydrogenase [Pseudonocardia sp. TRM90224]
MSYTLVMLPPQREEIADWPQRLEAAVPGLRVLSPETPDEAVEALRKADAAHGTLPAELLAQAEQLRWLQAPMAAPPAGYYHQALIDHPVQVTNMRDTYTDHVAHHTLALVLALARGLPRYVREQAASNWAPDWDPGAVLPLAEASALVYGVGAIGSEVGRLLAAFGTHVIGVDARHTVPPAGFAELRRPEALDDAMSEVDIVIVTVPHTPVTERMFDAERFTRMRPSGYFINIGRGPTVQLDALIAALDAGHLAGAALDVYETEPLPAEHPLWKRADVLLTPHVAGAGPHADERRFEVLVENARRFAEGQELINVVDKVEWH